MRQWLFQGFVMACCAGCGGDDDSGFAADAPERPEDLLPSEPTAPPPTGSRWSSTVVEGTCGRKTVEYRLVDEVCGETTTAAYLDAFRTPMFRDGARLGDVLFAVDGTHLWTLDVSLAADVKRLGITAGYGLPLGAGLHGTDLLLASGDEGLVVVDSADASRPVRRSDLALPGPALSLHVTGDLAFVAAGAAGVAVIDLAGTEPLLDRVIDVPGFAASVTVKDQLAVVAACDQMHVVDLTTDAVVSTTWLTDTEQADVAAPAKGVTVVGDVAFVAAGRWGAVAIDIGDPALPQMIGNCTVQDPAFYASGVRASEGFVFVAGGEWGVLAVDVVDPIGACPLRTLPEAVPAPPSDNGCSVEPPWEVVDWQTQWAPPPPPPPEPPPVPPRGRDPIQVLPFGQELYAFGDARRIGVRAIDIRTPDIELTRQGRYEEPGLVQAIAARGGRVLVAGPAGGLFVRDEASWLVRDAMVIDGVQQAIAAGLLEDGRWVVGFGDGAIRVEGMAEDFALGERLWPGTLLTRGVELVAARSSGARLVDLDARTETLLSFGDQVAALPPAFALDGDRIVAAAPEWTRARELTATEATELAPHAVFGDSEIADPARWRAGIPRRLLASIAAERVEVASLAGEAGLVVHGALTRSVPLPPGDYVGIAASTDRVHLISRDENEYRSQLVTVELSAAGPVVAEVQSFTGMAAGIAVDADRLYVADSDIGVRVYGAADAIPQPLGALELEVVQ